MTSETALSEENKTLFGLPVVVTKAVPKGTAILAPLPTAEDLQQYGSYANYVEARKHEFAMLQLDDEILSAEELE